MKRSNLFLSLLGVVAFTACSESDMPDVTNPVGKGEDRFLAVEISNPGTALLSRAAGDQTSDGDDVYEEGLDSENEINSLRFYFFDNSGNAVTVNPSSTANFISPTTVTESGEADMPNVEEKFEAVIVINTKEGDNANVNKMVAVANYEAADLGDASLSLSDLYAKMGDYSAVTKDEAAHFMMTSSSYADANGQVTAANILPANLATTEADAKANPVSIYIERVVAKTRLNTDWKGGIVTKEVTYNDNTYTAIALKDKDGNDIKVDDNQVYAIFTGWNVTGTADKAYFIKKVNSTTAWTANLWTTWNNPTFFRSYWAMNPDDVKLKYINYSSISKVVGTGVAYCLENAADNFDNGTKSSYNPATETSNRTQAIIAAVLVTVNGDVAQPISLAKWGGSDYTEEGVKTAMLNTVVNQLYTKDAANNLVSITANAVELSSAMDAGEADDESEDSKRYLSYLKLTTDAEKLTFYTKDGNEYKTEEVNTILANIPGAKVWRSGQTYYYTDLKHLNNAQGKETNGMYGVVRNHIYDVKINSVVGLGTPVLDPDEVIIPQKPKDDDTFIAAQINILSWRVVDNSTDLEW